MGRFGLWHGICSLKGVKRKKNNGSQILQHKENNGSQHFQEVPNTPQGIINEIFTLIKAQSRHNRCSPMQKPCQLISKNSFPVSKSIGQGQPHIISKEASYLNCVPAKAISFNLYPIQQHICTHSHNSSADCCKSTCPSITTITCQSMSISH